MNREMYLIIGLIALALAITGATILAKRGIETARYPHAKPGPWYGSYHAAWSAAHPGAFERGESQCGGFYAGGKWGSPNLDWDREWFRANGMELPREVFHAEGRALPGEARIGTLGPGESIRLDL